jgi:hypothetical protein
MFRLIIALICLCFSFGVRADNYPFTVEFYYSSSSNRFPSAQAACDSAPAYYGGASSTLVAAATSSGFKCDIYNQSGVLIQSKSIVTYETCPYGGTKGTYNGVYQCMNATACPTGQTRDVTGQCIAPPVNCGADEYNDGSPNGGVCKLIPACNLNNPDGNYYFDMATKECVISTTSFATCLSTTKTAFCPPIDNCVEPTFICSNNADAVANAAATRQQEIEAAKVSAQEKFDEIKTAAEVSHAALAARESAIEPARTAKQEAEQAIAAAKASGDQQALKEAFTAFNAASKEYLDAVAKASNSKSAAASVDAAQASAEPHVDAIPSSNPGNASAHNDIVSEHLRDALTAMDDARTGDGDGSGRGTGLPTSTGPSNDTSGLAKEGTLTGILNGIQGINDALGQPDSFSQGANVHGDGKTDGRTAIAGALCNGDCGSSPTCVSGSCSPSERITQLKNLYSISATATGECPAIEIDLSAQGWGSHSVSGHCQLMESVRGPVSVIMTITISIGFIMILMSA